MYGLVVYPCGREEKVSKAGGCFLVLDCDLLLLIPPDIVIIRKLEKKERVRLGGRNSRMKQTKNRPLEGECAVRLTCEWKNAGSLSQRMLKQLRSLCSYCPACF